MESTNVFWSSVAYDHCKVPGFGTWKRSCGSTCLPGCFSRLFWVKTIIGKNIFSMKSVHYNMCIWQLKSNMSKIFIKSWVGDNLPDSISAINCVQNILSGCCGFLYASASILNWLLLRLCLRNALRPILLKARLNWSSVMQPLRKRSKSWKYSITCRDWINYITEHLYAT